jgi:hypothetical protein
MKKLARYDQAVAVQAAAILCQKGIDINGSIVVSALMHASGKTKIGFDHFIKALSSIKRSGNSN